MATLKDTMSGMPVPVQPQTQQFGIPPGYYSPSPGVLLPIPPAPVFQQPVQTIPPMAATPSPMPTAEQALDKAEASVAKMEKVLAEKGENEVAEFMQVASAIFTMLGEIVLGQEAGKPITIGAVTRDILLNYRRKLEGEAAKAQLEAFEMHKFMERPNALQLLLDVREQELKARLLTAQRKNTTANRPPFKPGPQAGGKPQHKPQPPTQSGTQAPSQAATPAPQGPTLAQAKGAEKIAAMQVQLQAEQAKQETTTAPAVEATPAQTEPAPQLG